MVVFGRTETYSSPPHTFLQFVALVIKRLFYFFVFWAAGYSPIHTVINLVFFVPSLLLGAAALGTACLKPKLLSAAAHSTAAAAVLLFGLFAVFQSLQQLDFDWRYRLPCLALLVVLAGVGWKALEGERQLRVKEHGHPELTGGRP
jgi:hypothetical protein